MILPPKVEKEKEKWKESRKGRKNLKRSKTLKKIEKIKQFEKSRKSPKKSKKSKKLKKSKKSKNLKSRKKSKKTTFFLDFVLGLFGFTPWWAVPALSFGHEEGRRKEDPKSFELRAEPRAKNKRFWKNRIGKKRNFRGALKNRENSFCHLSQSPPVPIQKH